ncbi:MAG: hypothetical protein BZ135_02105 [Methanosphaera sp. rholeuAM6]|nr:MAG: hypothetical protein BZ135_02105 [Methanosphaera sp. rholeuAM6]
MNKKLIIGSILVLLVIIAGYVYISEINKADTEIPYINSHMQNGNNEYNQAVTYLNSKNYTLTTQHINESYKEYMLANESTTDAINKARNNNQSLQVKYLNYTLSELDCKINATVEMFNGLNYVNSNPSLALQYFANSNKLMINATNCSDERKLLEEQYPDKFINILSN